VMRVIEQSAQVGVSNRRDAGRHQVGRIRTCDRLCGHEQ
jgi:hypothetical protein